MTDDLRDRIGNEIAFHLGYRSSRATDAVWAQVSPELERLRAERDGLRSYRDEREAEIRAALIAAGEATGLPRPATLADAPGAVRAALFEQRQRAEQDALKANENERCTCGETACESELCDCDATPCPVNHRAEQAEAERDALKAAVEQVQADAIEQQKKTGITRDRWQLGVYAQASRTRRILRDALDTPGGPDSHQDAPTGGED